MHTTMSIDEQLNSFEPLIRSITKTFIKPDTKEDCLQEARVAAWQGIITHNATKKAKLSWYVTQCVRNRMIDLTKPKKNVPTLKFYGPLDETVCLGLDLSRVTTYNPFDCIDFDIFTRQVLNDKEYKLFKEYLYYGYSISEIVSNNENNIHMIKSDRRLRGDIKKCLRLIFQKLKSNAMNLPSKTLT